MAKFHINKHGVPAPCRAKSGNCPLGGEETHFNTKEEAQKSLDEKNKKLFGLMPEEKSGYSHRNEQLDKLATPEEKMNYVVQDFSKNVLNEDKIDEAGAHMSGEARNEQYEQSSFYHLAAEYLLYDKAKQGDNAEIVAEGDSDRINELFLRHYEAGVAWDDMEFYAEVDGEVFDFPYKYYSFDPTMEYGEEAVREIFEYNKKPTVNINDFSSKEEFEAYTKEYKNSYETFKSTFENQLKSFKEIAQAQKNVVELVENSWREAQNYVDWNKISPDAKKEFIQKTFADFISN
jgi:hypothetical protein